LDNRLNASHNPGGAEEHTVPWNKRTYGHSAPSSWLGNQRVHKFWSGGWRVVVTLLGWLAVISGILRIFLPFWAASIASTLGQSGTPVIIGARAPLLVGGFLSYKSFMTG
jgi:hypothetical protein